MSDQNESRRPGESWQQFQDRLVLQDQMRSAESLIKVQRAQFAEKTAQALEGLKQAIEADKKAGLADSLALRDSRPVRPAVLDEAISALAPKADQEKLAKLKAEAQEQYDSALVMAAPGMLTQEQILKELPGAILRTQQRLAAEDTAN